MDINHCSSTGFGQLSTFSIVCLPITNSVTCHIAEGGPGQSQFTASFKCLLDCSIAERFSRVRGCESYVQAVQTGRAIPLQEFTADLNHRMRGVWKNAELVDPNTHNNKLASYHSGLPLLLLEMSIFRLLYHGIFSFIL